MEIFMNFYNITVRFSSNSRFHIESIKKDFQYFVCNPINKPMIKIHAKYGSVEYDELPNLKSIRIHSEYVVYEKGNIRYVDYHGRALSVLNYRNETARIISKDKDLLYEISYLLIQSRVGEHLDKKGIHRLHASAIEYQDKKSHKGMIVLFVFPSGGGKSVVLVELMRNKCIKMISDDTPLITKNGRILPFPIRIGLKDHNKGRKFVRSKFGEKRIVDINEFKGRISRGGKPDIIFIAKRSLSNKFLGRRISRLGAFSDLFKVLVVGYGLPQVVEYFLRAGFLRNLNKVPLVLSRLCSVIKLLYSTKVYQIILGRNIEINIKGITRILEKKSLE